MTTSGEAMNSTNPAVDVAPLNLMNRTDQQAHLREYHNQRTYDGITTKTTKEQMEKVHERLHRTDNASEYGTRRPMVNHTHSPLPEISVGVDEPQVDTDAALVRLGEGKTLTATERRALEKLVDNDFAALANEVNQFADDIEREKIASVRAEWAEKEALCKTYTSAVERTIADAQTALRSLVAEASVNGISLGVPSIDRYGSTSAEVTGLTAAVNRVKEEVRQDRRRALGTLERQRLTAQRTVLLSAVSREAAKVLDTIPTARDLMVQAQQTRADATSISA